MGFDAPPIEQVRFHYKQTPLVELRAWFRYRTEIAIRICMKDRTSPRLLPFDWQSMQSIGELNPICMN